MPELRKENLFKEAAYIDGRWYPSKGQSIQVHNPFDGSLLGVVPKFAEAETLQAITAADKAFPSFQALSAKARADLLLAWHQKIFECREDLAKLMTLEQGKPYSESLAEIDYANAFIRWFAEEARRAYGDVIPSNNPKQHLVILKQAIGVVGAITPWNFPAAMITRKVAPALAVGCTVVLKPASETPFTALALAVLAEEVGFPPGVLNVVTGDAQKIGGTLTESPFVRKISFTGSTAVGKLLMAQSASTIKKVSLELGGNAPFIVFNDADMEAAVSGVIASKFRNSGQTCVCANRIYVHDAIYDDFTMKLIPAVQRLHVGNGLEKDVNQGPLINQAAIDKVNTHLQDAVAKGGKILTGGKLHPAGKLCFTPTVITEANQTMMLAKEETFGPVAPLFRFKTEAEAIEAANNTEFGLAAYFYSNDVHRIWRVAQSLQYGMVGINAGIVSTEVAPFGGIKESGIGREGSKYGLDEYLEIKYLNFSPIDQQQN